MMLKAFFLVILAGSTLSLSACATHMSDAGEAVAPGAVASSPAPVAGYDWFYNKDDDTREASLTYGLAESDEAPLGLRCKAGAQVVTLNRPTPNGRPARITLESGGDTETYAAQSEEDPVHDGQFLTTSAPVSDPVFLQFRRVSWLAVLDDSARVIMAAHPGSSVRIERFFAYCG